MRRRWRGTWIRKGAASAKAYDGSLEKLLAAVNAAASQGGAMWLSLLTLGTYLFVVVGATTHRDLLQGGSVKLPLLSTELPLFIFYWAAPLLFILLHVYTLLNLDVIHGKLELFEEKLTATLVRIGDPAKRTATEAVWRRQLDPFLYVQMRAAPAGDMARQALIRFAVWFTVVISPVLLLLSFQIRFLPYHYEMMTWAHRGFVLLDLSILLLLWPEAARAREVRRWPIALFAVLVLPFSVLIATIPGETEDWGLQPRGQVPWWLTRVLFEGRTDNIARTVMSPLSRNIVLPDAVLIDRDSLDKVKTTLNLRGRDLRFANFVGADLRKTDLYGAQLQSANLHKVQLQEANLEAAKLPGANFLEAQLQGANLRAAELQGADFVFAKLQGANFENAELQGADLGFAKAQGAFFFNANLQVADLNMANMRGADLEEAKLQGANLGNAQLQGANLSHGHLSRSRLNDTDLTLSQMQEINLDPMRPQEVEDLRSKLSNVSPHSYARVGLGELAEGWEEERETAAQDAWERAASQQLPLPIYEPALAEYLTKLGCAPENAPFVARAMAKRISKGVTTYYVRMINLRSAEDSHKPLLAKALSDPSCAGARGLTAEEREALQDVIDFWAWIHKVIDKPAAQP